MSCVDVKLIVIGDGGIGKTSLLYSYAKNIFPEKYEPTVFDCLTTHLEKRGQKIKLHLWDTAGQEEYDSLRSLSYHKADIFLVCFSINDESSYENVKERWIKDLIGGSVPFVLVGLKSDLRNSDPARGGVITYRQGLEMASKIGAKDYFECSALTKSGVEALFNGSLEIVFNPNQSLLLFIKKIQSVCNIM